MKVTTEELERCEILMTVEVEPAEEQDMLKKAAKRIARQVQVPGFRPGKAPYGTVVRRFGIEAVQQEALENSGEKLVENALKEADLNPTAQLSFDEVSWNPLTLKLRVPGPPKVELGDYRAIRLETKPIEVTAEDIDKELKALQEQNATWVPVERPAEIGDLITMSVIEKDGDEVLSEHDSVEYELLLPEEDESADDEGDDEVGGNEPDLTTPLLGLSAGEEKTFDVTYPDNYDDDRYAGKDITFTVNVSSVKEKELDSLDDDFAQAMGDFETLDELKERIETNLRERREFGYNQELGQEVLDKIVEEAEQIDWPVALEEEMIDNEIERFSEQFKRAGITLDSYLRIEKKTKEDLREDIRATTVESLKKSIVLGEVAKLEKLSVSNSEILERAKIIADMFGGGSERIWQNLISSDLQQSRIANEVLTSKVITRLAEIAKGEALEPGEETAAEAETEEVEEQTTSPDSGDDNLESETTEEPVATKA